MYYFWLEALAIDEQFATATGNAPNGNCSINLYPKEGARLGRALRQPTVDR